MAKILDFQKKRHTQTECHSMSCTREDDWLIWCCHSCSRKFKTNLVNHQSVVERTGNLTAHHIYHPYQPSEEEMETIGLSHSLIDTDFSFT